MIAWASPAQPYGCHGNRPRTGTLESAVSERKRLPARATLAERGDPLRQSRTLISGFMIHYIDGLEGQRQVVAFTSPATSSTFKAIRSKRSIIRSDAEASIATASHDTVKRLTEPDAELACGSAPKAGPRSERCNYLRCLEKSRLCWGPIGRRSRPLGRVTLHQIQWLDQKSAGVPLRRRHSGRASLIDSHAALEWHLFQLATYHGSSASLDAPPTTGLAFLWNAGFCISKTLVLAARAEITAPRSRRRHSCPYWCVPCPSRKLTAFAMAIVWAA